MSYTVTFPNGEATVDRGQWQGKPRELVAILRELPSDAPTDYPDRDLWHAERAAELLGGGITRRSPRSPRATRTSEQ